jgi:hypothetical protein
MAVIPLRRRRTRNGFGAIVTPGTSTYPSQDGTFAIVRGSGSRWGNGLIDGWLIAGTTLDGYYALDSNDTGLIVDDQTVGRRYKVGSEYDAFVNSSETSPEYIAYEIALRQQQEQQNPKLKAYDDALRRWAISQQPPVSVDPVYGFATGYDASQAPPDVQAAYADFTGNPMPLPPPPPARPAEYLQGGITFDDAGNVYDSSGNPIPGVVLTPAEVASLKATGSLPSGDSGPAGLPGHSAPPPQQQTSAPPSSSSSAPAGTTGGTTDGNSPATSAGSNTTAPPAGGGQAAPSGELPVDVGTAPMSVAPAPAAAAPAASSLPWGMIGLVGAGVVGAIVLSRARSKGSKGGRRR